MKKMSFSLKQYDVGIVTIKYNFDGVGQSIIIVILLNNNSRRNEIFLPNAIACRIEYRKWIVHVTSSWVEFLSRMNNVFANEKKMRFLSLQPSYQYAWVY